MESENKIKYILLNVNYDGGETCKQEFPDVEGLQKKFEGDEDLLGELLNEGVFEWEWGVFHLINLGDYE